MLYLYNTYFKEFITFSFLDCVLDCDSRSNTYTSEIFSNGTKTIITAQVSCFVQRNMYLYILTVVRVRREWVY